MFLSAKFIGYKTWTSGSSDAEIFFLLHDRSFHYSKADGKLISL